MSNKGETSYFSGIPLRHRVGQARVAIAATLKRLTTAQQRSDRLVAASVELVIEARRVQAESRELSRKTLWASADGAVVCSYTTRTASDDTVVIVFQGADVWFTTSEDHEFLAREAERLRRLFCE